MSDDRVERLAEMIHAARTDVPMCTPDMQESCWPIAVALLTAGVRVEAT